MCLRRRLLAVAAGVACLTVADEARAGSYPKGPSWDALPLQAKPRPGPKADDIYVGSPKPSKVLSTDLNGDGRLDLVALGDEKFGSAASASVVSSYLGLGGGRFRMPSSATVPSGISYSIQLGDFDNDGHLDLLAVSYSAMRLHRGTGRGTFLPADPRRFDLEVSGTAV